MVTFFHSKKKRMNWNAVAHLIVSTYDKLNNQTRHISLLHEPFFPFIANAIAAAAAVSSPFRPCLLKIYRPPQKILFLIFFLWLNEKYQTLLALSQSNQVKSDQFL